MKCNTIHGIDLTAPGGLEALFAHNRARFGDATMMAEGDPTPTPPAPVPAPPADPPADDPTPADDPWADPVKARAEIDRLRRENGDARVNAKQQAAQEARDELLQKLGLKDGDKPVDPEELARQLAAKDSDLSAKEERIRALTIERGLTKAARTNGADEDLLVAVLSHKGSLNDLYPSADDFTTRLEAIVKKEVEANPKLRAALAAGQSGADFTGGSGDKRSRTPLPLREAAAKLYGN